MHNQPTTTEHYLHKKILMLKLGWLDIYNFSQQYVDNNVLELPLSRHNLSQYEANNAEKVTVR